MPLKLNACCPYFFTIVNNIQRFQIYFRILLFSLGSSLCSLCRTWVAPECISLRAWLGWAGAFVMCMNMGCTHLGPVRIVGDEFECPWPCLIKAHPLSMLEWIIYLQFSNLWISFQTLSQFIHLFVNF